MAKSWQVPILMYHRLAAKAASKSVEERSPYLLAESSFEEQMGYLSSKAYSTISLSDFITYVNDQAVSPQKPVIITFDDGNWSDYTLAYPILRKYGFRATFFVVVESIGSPGRLSWEQIMEMSRNRMAIQSHTLTHPYLTKLSRWQIEAELNKSKTILEDRIRKPVHFLAVPGGMYNTTLKTIAKETGYLAVVTSDLGINTIQTDLCSLKRIAVKRGITLHKFTHYLEGQGMFWGKSIQLLKTVFRIKHYAAMRRKRHYA